MASIRTYIPSIAVLRALSRPLPPQCPLARLVPIESRRGIRKDPRDRSPPIPKLIRKLAKDLEARTDGVTQQKGTPSFTKMSIYEQDLDTNSPPRLVKSIDTPEKYDEFEKKWYRQVESYMNEDMKEFNKEGLDDLIQDPRYAHLRDKLEEMKQSVEDLPEGEELGDLGDPKNIIKEFDSAMFKSLHEWTQEALEKPEYAAARGELLEFQSKLPQWTEDNSGFQNASELLDKKLREIPGVGKVVEEMKKLEQEALQVIEEMNKKDPLDDIVTDEWLEEFDRDEADLDDLFKDQKFVDFLKEKGDDVDALKNSLKSTNPADELDVLLIKMKELMAAMGGNKEIENEIQSVLDDDPRPPPDDKQYEIFDMKELRHNMKYLKENPWVPPEWDINVDGKAQAMVDQLMADPQLLRKLSALKDRMNKSQVKSTKTLKAPSAPDPETLDRSRLASYRDRLAVAENDPEHLAALSRLQINLLRPFNVSPALRSLNESLKLAYLGASDDVRRVLWRSYIKARTVPTLLQNIPDDAWDMLWYSQAVTWRSNQNRQSHMRILLGDLRSVGREGPPTHPDTLEEEQ